MVLPIRFDNNKTGLKFGSVYIYGQQGMLSASEPSSHPKALAKRVTGRLTTILIPPSSPDGEGFGQTVPTAGVVRADGTLVPEESGSCVVGHSRDCPYLVVENWANRLVGIAHVSRDGLWQDVVQGLLDRVAPSGDRSQVHGFITGGIGHDHFRHEQNIDLVMPLLIRQCNDLEPILIDCKWWALDIFATIRNELTREGVPRSHIRTDGLCTYCDERFGSKRAAEAGEPDKDKMNWVMVRRT